MVLKSNGFHVFRHFLSQGYQFLDKVWVWVPYFPKSSRYIDHWVKWHGVEARWSRWLHPLSGRNHSESRPQPPKSTGPWLHRHTFASWPAGTWAGISMVILLSKLGNHKPRLWPLHQDLIVLAVVFSRIPTSISRAATPCQSNTATVFESQINPCTKLASFQLSKSQQMTPCWQVLRKLGRPIFNVCYCSVPVLHPRWAV